MDLTIYQTQARETDRVPLPDPNAVVVPLLGIAGEVGDLLVEYKKKLRDGDAHRLFRPQVAEELGDLLWYLANLASKFDLDLSEIARDNLAKTRDRWPVGAQDWPRLFDEDFPADEQLPRELVVEFRQHHDDVDRPVVQLFRGGVRIGDPIRDNAPDPDHYRFHDVFHLAHAAILGWSPVLRKLLGCKRKSDAKVDEVEDGGRAIVIDEAIVAFVFEYARRHNFFQEGADVDYGLLKTIRGLVSTLEVRAHSLADFARAIHEGYRAWNVIRQHEGGTVSIDLRQHTIKAAAPGDAR